MSAFILNDDEMQKIGNYLYSAATTNPKDPYRRDTWTFLGAGFGENSPRYAATEIEREAIVRKKLDELYQMNIEAVDQRYNDQNAGKLPRLKLRSVTMQFNEFYKLLSCLRYQCSEGNVPKTELYKQLDLYIGKVCEVYIRGG